MKINPYVEKMSSSSIKPQSAKILDVSTLNGGLNLWELDYKISQNQSPNMKNMYWRDGALGARKGQRRMWKTDLDTPIYASYERPFVGKGIFHSGTKLYALDMGSEYLYDGVDDPDENNSFTGVLQIYEGLSEKAGTFFVFREKLYYFNGAQYLEIGYANGLFTVNPVTPYTPVVVINRTPTGGGDYYQPENRLSSKKIVRFSVTANATSYNLPVSTGSLSDLTLDYVRVDGVNLTAGTDYTLETVDGVKTGNVILTNALTPHNPPVNNGLEICYSLPNLEAFNSIMTCRCCTTYGSGNDYVVVMAGPDAQPNAFFWSGSNYTLDPTYFPMDHYNLAGQGDDPIVRMAMQQDMLIIFQTRAVGKANFDTTEVDGYTYLTMPFTNINRRLGCDLPKSVQLVENNLVFANSYSGVYILLDTSEANENNIQRISLNINGTDARQGLLHDIKEANSKNSVVSSVDDDARYWIIADGNAYVWDYTLSPFSLSGGEKSLSWFLFTNINANTWIVTTEDIFYGAPGGYFVRFIDARNDHGSAIEKLYEFSVLSFGNYYALKSIDKIVLSTRNDTNNTIDINYITDYGEFPELTPVSAEGWRLFPRNLGYRNLAIFRFAKISVRTPGLFHIRHFSMRLKNEVVNEDMSLIGMEIYYRFTEVDR